MNTLNIFTHLSLNAVQSLLAEGIGKVAVIYDSNDQISKQFLRDHFGESVAFLDIGLPDSQYAVFRPITKNCRSIIYLQNYFTLNADKLLTITHNVPEYSAAFTLSAYSNGTRKELKDLATVDLGQLTQR